MKEKLKVYHGLPKTPTNENTLFYASFDGSLRPEIHHGPMIKQGEERSFSAGITGYCLKEVNNRSEITYEFPEYATNNLPEVSTVDLWAYYPGYQEGKIMRFAYAMFCDIIVLQDEYLFVGFWRDRLRVKKLEKGYYHFRLILKPLNRTTGETSVDLYINGKKEGTYVTTISDSENPPATVSLGHMNNDSYACAVSDVHVSLEDLGDYFPTLPQDYIDGKAIVVPALNQRQSYGDPVLHQVTELVVKNQPSEILGTIYDLNDRDADGLERCFTNPELRTAYAHTWEQGNSKIRIQGLDNSIITGVFDTNTAKAKVIKSSYAPNTKLYLDTVDGLSVGDTIVLAEVASTGVWMTDYTITIQGINTTEKSITITSSDWNVTAGKHYIFETTASSSSPIVETVDGFTVNGTWSGLGTHQATFTLGSNSNIAGKDLIVKYCLNAIGDVSPYPKMPSEVIRGYDENGTELTPQNSAIIFGDYLNKKAGETTVCPHKLYWQNSSTLTDFDGTEYEQEGYNCVLNNPESLVYTSFPREYPMIIAEVDVFHLIETQLGETIPGNKINWVKDNVLSVKCHANCVGSYGSNNYVEIRYQVLNSNQWNLNSGTSCYHNADSFRTIHANISTEQLPTNGIKRFCITTKNTYEDLIINTVQVQYIYFTVEFKPDVSKDTHSYLLFRDEPFYKLDDKRNSKPCNPIIINTQTKEVRRLLPSTKPFATEVILYNSGDITSVPNSKLLVSSNQHLLTTMGTGNLETNVRNEFRGLIGKLDLTNINSSNYLGEHSYKLPVNTGNNTNGTKFVLSQPFSENFNFYQIEECFPNVRHLALKHTIVESNNELYLRLVCLDLDSDILKTSIHQYYKLPNRPLIK